MTYKCRCFNNYNMWDILGSKTKALNIPPTKNRWFWFLTISKNSHEFTLLGHLLNGRCPVIPIAGWSLSIQIRNCVKMKSNCLVCSNYTFSSWNQLQSHFWELSFRVSPRKGSVHKEPLKVKACGITRCPQDSKICCVQWRLNIKVFCFRIRRVSQWPHNASDRKKGLIKYRSARYPLAKGLFFAQYTICGGKLACCKC